MIFVQWTDFVEGGSLGRTREGRVVGYVTDAHNKVCAIVMIDRALRHVPIERLIVSRDTKQKDVLQKDASS